MWNIAVLGLEKYIKRENVHLYISSCIKLAIPPDLEPYIKYYTYKPVYPSENCLLTDEQENIIRTRVKSCEQAFVKPYNKYFISSLSSVFLEDGVQLQLLSQYWVRLSGKAIPIDKLGKDIRQLLWNNLFGNVTESSVYTSEDSHVFNHSEQYLSFFEAIDRFLFYLDSSKQILDKTLVLHQLPYLTQLHRLSQQFKQVIIDWQ